MAFRWHSARQSSGVKRIHTIVLKKQGMLSQQNARLRLIRLARVRHYFTEIVHLQNCSFPHYKTGTRVTECLQILATNVHCRRFLVQVLSALIWSKVSLPGTSIYWCLLQDEIISEIMVKNNCYQCPPSHRSRLDLTQLLSRIQALMLFPGNPLIKITYKSLRDNF